MFETSQIKEHMEVVGADGGHVGTIDRVEDVRQVKLAASDAPDGEHHYLAIDLIERVDDKVHLRLSTDEARLQLQ